jgi:uncharacterized protein YgfB (UPF0149 family)
MTKPIEFFDLEGALFRAEADYGASEVQAIACGMLAVNTGADKITWVQLIFGEIDGNNATQTAAIKMCGDLFEQTKIQLQDSNLALELLLPDENEPLDVRVRSHQEWCSGFILGMALSGVKDFKDLPEDSRELLADFKEIGTAGNFDLEEEDESEDALAEISEYIRMGVLLINEELQPIKQSTLIH